MRILGCWASLVLAGCASAPPGEPRPLDIEIDHAILLASVETGADVAAYAGFENRAEPDRLLGIDCTCAASIELHHVVRDGDTMRMDDIFPMALPTGRTEVRPPGLPLHFMLMGTTRRFDIGERVELTFRFERAGVQSVAFTVVQTSTEGWASWSPD